MRIDSIQGRQWSGIEAKFAVVVVLNHQTIMRLGPGEQVHTARDGETHTQRILVRWRHIDKRRSVNACGQRIYTQSIIVNGQRKNMRALS